MPLDVKVGDQVVLYASRQRSITTVTKITPTGRINTSSGLTFYPDGKQVGADLYYPCSIHKATPALLEEIQRDKFTGQVLRQMQTCRALTYEQAVEIQRILKGTE